MKVGGRAAIDNSGQLLFYFILLKVSISSFCFCFVANVSEVGRLALRNFLSCCILCVLPLLQLQIMTKVSVAVYLNVCFKRMFLFFQAYTMIYRCFFHV